MTNYNEFDVARYQVKNKLKDLVLLDIKLRRNLLKNKSVADATYRGCIEFECGRAFERLILHNALNINIKEIVLESSKVTDELISQYSLFEENVAKEIDFALLSSKARLYLTNYNNDFNTIKYKLDTDTWHKIDMKNIFRVDQLAIVLKEDLEYKGAEI